VDNVSLVEQELCEIRAILTSDASNQSHAIFHGRPICDPAGFTASARAATSLFDYTICNIAAQKETWGPLRRRRRPMSFQASNECRPVARNLRRNQLYREKVPQPSYASGDGEWGASKIDRLLARKTPDGNICEAVFLHIFWQIDVS
jgi:hypothetical protein